MSHGILLGYAGGIITITAISGYPEYFKPTIVQNPRSYLVVGTALAIAAVGLNLLGGGL